MLKVLKVLVKHKLFIGTSVLLGGVCGIINNSDADLSLSFASPPPQKSQDGKIVWIVGASSGIGASLAIDMAKAGAKVVVSARRQNLLENVARDCEKFSGVKPMILPLDITDIAQHENAVNKIMMEHGKIDMVVLNAGISQRNLVADTPFMVTENIMKTNFLSYVSLTKCILPSMMENKNGKIVVISSLAGLISLPISTSYSASKFALHGFYNGFRSEVASDNIKVALVCPGPVESEIAAKAHKNPKLPNHEDGKKMPTERCTELILRGLHHDLDEMWISEAPFLAMAYVSVYFPSIARYYVDNVLGPTRVHALKTGQAIYGEPKK